MRLLVPSENFGVYIIGGELQMKPYHLILDFTHVYDDEICAGRGCKW